MYGAIDIYGAAVRVSIRTDEPANVLGSNRVSTEEASEPTDAGEYILCTFLGLLIVYSRTSIIRTLQDLGK